MKSVVKNKGNKPFMKVHVFSFKVAVVTFNCNKTRKGVRIILNLIHFTGNIQGWGIPVMKLSYLNYLGNNIF
jgi:hypothetical protein